MPAGDSTSTSGGSPVPLVPPAGPAAILRVLDANFNRAQEGLRVVEEYARFILDDAHLAGLCKELRHELAGAFAEIAFTDRLAARDTEGDVGTDLSAAREQARGSAVELVAANAGRVQEALRCLEEYSKLIDPRVAEQVKPLRYRVYTLAKAMGCLAAGGGTPEPCLYVLLGGGSERQLVDLARRLMGAGVRWFQLRDKSLRDRELLAAARAIRAATAEEGVKLIVNDRPDIAVLSRADGVHVGQEELSVREARSVVGTGMMIGVSTHNIEQARRAVLDGADYIGVGAVFPSSTKQFDKLAGLELVRQVAQEIRLPAFAIGGITAENVHQVTAAGIRRVAVSHAVAAAASPAAAARKLLAALNS